MGFLDLFRVGKIKKENEALKQKLQLLHADDIFKLDERLDKMNRKFLIIIQSYSNKREEISILYQLNSKN